MKKTLVTVFVVSLFLLMPLQAKVAADVVQETRYLHIEADQDTNVTYSSLFNIVNNTTNQKFTNFELLVNPFITATGTDGGYSGSFLPPARFQVDTANVTIPTPTQHDNLVLASVVEFKKKNVLSGASESWWRCPFWFNHSTNNNFGLEIKIFHVDLPRKVNLTFQGAGNSNPMPNAESHPSLVFSRSFVNAANTRDNELYWTEQYIDIPINDTWNNSKTPNLLTPGEINWIDETEGYDASGDFEYYQTFNYSFIWANVTAPIYPNESYMAIWNIHDTNIPAGDEGACWVTATDIGRNEYGRFMFSWNSQTVYEVPIDLDCSVIFRTGLGDGVTGANLTYNDPEYYDHTGNFTNTDFEMTMWGLESNFSAPFATSGWSTQVSHPANFWIYRNAGSNQTFFEANVTSSILPMAGQWGRLHYDYTTSPLPSEGETMKIDLEMIGARGYENQNHGLVSHNIAVGLYFEKDSGEGDHLFMSITRRRTVETDGSVIIDNYVAWIDSGTAVQRVKLPDTMSEKIYVSIQNDESQDESYVYIYDQDQPQRRIFGMAITDKDSTAGSADNVSIYFAVDAQAGLSGSSNYWLSWSPTIDAGVVLKANKVTIVDRTSSLNWNIVNPLGGSMTSPSKHDFIWGFETSVPDYDPIGTGKNTKCMGFTASAISTVGLAGVYQTQSFTVPSNRRLFASCYYQMRYNDSAQPYTNSYVQLGIHGWNGFTWSSKYSYGYNLDSAWHQISTGHLIGSFSQVNISIYVFFYPGSNIDIKLALVDNVKVFSIENGPWYEAEFWQQIDQSDFNATNYLTLMLPFRHTYEPKFPPIVSIQFFDVTGSATGTIQRTMPTDFYNDFLIHSINRTNVPTDATHVKMRLANFGNSSYLFLHDRNSDFYLNNATEYKFNYFEEVDTGNNRMEETFFSSYYSLKATAGQWTNADSIFTTTPFYFVRVHFVRFVGNDPEIISVQMFSVDLADFEMFRFNMGQFGQVYDNDEWLLYLEIRNRPTLFDRIVDLFADFFRWLSTTPIGRLFGAIGKFIHDVLVFVVSLIQSLAFIILEAIIFIISVAIYIFGSWIMWKFVKFWILIGEGKPEEGIDVLTETTQKTTSLAGKITGRG